MRTTLTSLSVCLAASIAVLAGGLTPVSALESDTGSASDSDIAVSWQVEDDAAAPVIRAVVSNGSDTGLPAWQVTLGFPHLVTDVSGAISVQDESRLTLSSDQALGAGAETTVRLSVSALGSEPLAAQWCETPAGTCRLLLDVPATGKPAPSTGSSRSPAASLEVTYRVDQDWGSGQSVVMPVTNQGSAATRSWGVDIPAGVRVDSMWNAVSVSGGGDIRAVNADWNGYLAPGDTIEFGFVVLPGGNPEWRECPAWADESAVDCGISAANSWSRYPELPDQW